MNLDALTLAALRAELQPLVGGRVQRVIRPAPLALGMEIYGGERRYLYISADPQEGVICLLDARPRRGAETVSPLQLLLRKYVQGARLTSLDQMPYERVLTLAFVGAHGHVTLVCELMGRMSNLVLIDAQRTVLDAARRIPGRVNRYRSILPGRPYVPPPRGDKLRPGDLSTDALLGELAHGEGPLWRRLVGVVFGVSPTMAREIMFRVVGSCEGADSPSRAQAEEIVGLLQGLWRMPGEGGWRPSVAWEAMGGADAECARRALAVAPYALTHLPGNATYPSMAEALRAFRAVGGTGETRMSTGAGSAITDPYAAARRRVKGLIGDARARQEAHLRSLHAALVSDAGLEALRWRGSALLAVVDRIALGQQVVAVSPYDVSGLEEDRQRPPVLIDLDPRRSPADNAQEWFRLYRKRRDAAAQVPALIAQAQSELGYLEQLDSDADLAADRPALDRVEAALIAAGYPGRAAKRPSSGSPAKAPPGEPLHAHAPDGTLVLVGRNSAGNQVVTFRLAGMGDLWLHARGVPGAHVVVRCGVAEASAETLAFAAALAARHSAARYDRQVQVDCTRRRYVRPIKGGRPGMVTYSGERTLSVMLGGADVPQPSAGGIAL